MGPRVGDRLTQVVLGAQAGDPFSGRPADLAEGRPDRAEQIEEAPFVATGAAQGAVHLPAPRYRIGRNGLRRAGDRDDNDGEAAET